jgi:hypothetical protein
MKLARGSNFRPRLWRLSAAGKSSLVRYIRTGSSDAGYVKHMRNNRWKTSRPPFVWGTPSTERRCRGPRLQTSGRYLSHRSTGLVIPAWLRTDVGGPSIRLVLPETTSVMRCLHSRKNKRPGTSPTSHSHSPLLPVHQWSAGANDEFRPPEGYRRNFCRTCGPGQCRR